MSSLNFLDVNVWLALVWARHSHSEAARRWFEPCEGDRFFFCRFTQMALLRLLTTEAVMGRDVKTMSQAWRVYDACHADERIEILAEPHGIETSFRALAKSRLSSPKAWADAYLAAFCIRSRIATGHVRPGLSQARGLFSPGRRLDTQQPTGPNKLSLPVGCPLP